jgi:hypothetical protein
VKCRRGHHGVQTRGARAADHGIEDERHARLRALSRSVVTAGCRSRIGVGCLSVVLAVAARAGQGCRLPRGVVSPLVGDEGIGKSLLWGWVIAAVTTGGRRLLFPEFDISRRDPEHVLIAAITEDDWQTVVRPRLEVAGADLDMVWVVCTDSDGSGAPTFPRPQHAIDEIPRPIAESDPSPTHRRGRERGSALTRGAVSTGVQVPVHDSDRTTEPGRRSRGCRQSHRRARDRHPHIRGEGSREAT